MRVVGRNSGRYGDSRVKKKEGEGVEGRSKKEEKKEKTRKRRALKP